MSYFFRDVALLKRRLRDEANNLKIRVDKRAIKVGKCTETYIEFFILHHEYDAFLVAPEPPNPWITDSTELWDMYTVCAREQVAERRVRRWSFSCWDMLKDPIGHDHFKAYLEKEYATENLLFVEAVWKMKKLASKGNIALSMVSINTSAIKFLSIIAINFFIYSYRCCRGV